MWADSVAGSFWLICQDWGVKTVTLNSIQNCFRLGSSFLLFGGRGLAWSEVADSYN